jgi:hypothetical protein
MSKRSRLRSLRTALMSVWLLVSYGVPLGALTNVALANGRTIRSLTIKGKVLDSLGRPLAGVHVSLLNVSGVAIGERLTNSAGDYRFPVATTGHYAVIADKAGFRHSVITVLVSPTGSSIPAIVMESEQPLTMSVRAARLRAQNDLSRTGASKYTLTDHDITNLPVGKYTPLNQVMLQMPGVTLDQNQEIHIRSEHMGIQYQMNGILLPLDINTDPAFTQLLNSFYIKTVSLLDGILPARYGYRTAGVIDIVTKQGCQQPGGDFSILGGQRSTAEPSFEIGGCKRQFRLLHDWPLPSQQYGLQFRNAGSRPDPRRHESGAGLRQFHLSTQPSCTAKPYERIHRERRTVSQSPRYATALSTRRHQSAELSVDRNQFEPRATGLLWSFSLKCSARSRHRLPTGLRDSLQQRAI